MIYLTIIFSHFTLIGSREQKQYSDNQRFYPIAGGGVSRPVSDCTQLPATAVKAISPGVQSFPFEIGNFASHIGLCQAFLIQDGKVTKLNEERDCVSINKAMKVDIPNVNCPNCILKIKVAAAHMVTFIEFYDSCLDISIGGPEKSIKFGETSTNTKPKVETPVVAPPTTPVVAPVVPATPASQGFVCSADGKSYSINGYTMQMAAGTKCVQDGNNISVRMI